MASDGLLGLEKYEYIWAAIKLLTFCLICSNHVVFSTQIHFNQLEIKQLRFDPVVQGIEKSGVSTGANQNQKDAKAQY